MKRVAGLVAVIVLALSGTIYSEDFSVEEIMRRIEAYETRFSYCEASWREETFTETESGRKPAGVCHYVVTARFKEGWQFVQLIPSVPQQQTYVIVCGEGWTLRWLRTGEDDEGTVALCQDDYWSLLGGRRNLVPFEGEPEKDDFRVLNRNDGRLTVEFYSDERGRRSEWEYEVAGKDLRPIRLMTYSRVSKEREYELYSTRVYHYGKLADGRDELKRIEDVITPHNMVKVYDILKLNFNPTFGGEGFDPGLPWRTKIVDPATGKRLFGERDEIEDWLTRAGTQAEPSIMGVPAFRGSSHAEEGGAEGSPPKTPAVELAAAPERVPPPAPGPIGRRGDRRVFGVSYLAVVVLGMAIVAILGRRRKG